MSNNVKICDVTNIIPGQVNLFQLENKEIAFCQMNDKYYAFDNECTHQFGSLSDGWLEEYKIECPLHGAQFDIRNGKALCLPAVEDIETYEVVINGNEVFIKTDKNQ